MITYLSYRENDEQGIIDRTNPENILIKTEKEGKEMGGAEVRGKRPEVKKKYEVRKFDNF